MASFQKELEALINRHCMENRSDTPDFILARYMNDCLQAFDRAVVRREQWYSRKELLKCRACGEPLIPENFRIADGCPCNSGRGVNHGIVAKDTCTCVECDPAQTGSTRYPIEEGPEPHNLRYCKHCPFAEHLHDGHGTPAGCPGFEPASYSPSFNG